MAAAAAEAPAAPAEQDAYIELWEAGEILATPLVKPEVPSPVGDAAGEPGMAPLARALLKRFAPGELATFRAWACAGSQKIATICSGTDVVSHCNDEFSAALAEAASANLDFEQVFPCECNGAKQDFLRKTHPKLKVLPSRSGVCRRTSRRTLSAATAWSSGQWSCSRIPLHRCFAIELPFPEF